MDHFHYKQKTLHTEDVALPELAAKIGTPFYCYSSATLIRHYCVFSEAVSAFDHRICFAVKANGSLGVLATLARQGAGADVVSEGEIRLSLAAGVTPDKIVFSGVGKTPDELRFGLEQNIFQFNIESLSELHALSAIAAKMGKTARIAVRVNPDVDPGTHAKISTGQKASKFGVPMAQALAVYQEAARLPGIAIQGVSVHIGSQLTQLEPFLHAFQRVRDLVAVLRAEGFAITTVDLGGGLGIPYEQAKDAPPLPEGYGAIVRETMQGIGATLIFEPGRLIAGNAGILVSRVIYVKQAEGRTYVILDAAMNDLIRPSLYDAYHDIIPVVQDASRPVITADIVGPVCETGDTFATDRALPEVREGELVAFRSTGAYGATMSSTYNARPLVPEALVDGARFAVTRARPSYQDMLDAQQVPSWL